MEVYACVCSFDFIHVYVRLFMWKYVSVQVYVSDCSDIYKYLIFVVHVFIVCDCGRMCMCVCSDICVYACDL